jgi:hypothetical protein
MRVSALNQGGHFENELAVAKHNVHFYHWLARGVPGFASLGKIPPTHPLHELLLDACGRWVFFLWDHPGSTLSPDAALLGQVPAAVMDTHMLPPVLKDLHPATVMVLLAEVAVGVLDER